MRVIARPAPFILELALFSRCSLVQAPPMNSSHSLLQSGLLSRWARPDALAWTAFVLAVVWAYRALLFFDPGLNAPSDIEPLEGWFFSAAGESPLLVLALTAWLTMRRIPGLRSDQSGPASSLIGATGLILAAGLALWAHYTSASQVLTLSLGILLVSSGLFLGGLPGARTLMMPTVFVVLLATPIPPPLLNYLIYPMQIWTAEAVVAIVRLTGFAVRQSGDLILTPWAIFQVIETCAGLRAVQTLVMTAFVYGELIGLRFSRRVALVIIAPLIGLTVNVARVLLLVLDPSPDSQPDHSIQGVVMLIVGVFMLWGIDEALDRWWTREREEERADRVVGVRNDRRAVVPQSSSTARVWFVVALLLMAALGHTAIVPWTPSGSAAETAHSIPREIGDWRMDRALVPVDEDYLASVRFSSRTWRRYEREDEVVTLFAAANDRLRRSTSLVSDKTLTLQAGSFVLDEPRAIHSDGECNLSELTVQTKEGKIWLVHHGYEQIRSVWAETLRSALALDRGPWRRSEPSLVVRMATPMEPGPAEKKQARRRLAEFERHLRPEIDAIKQTSPGVS